MKFFVLTANIVIALEKNVTDLSKNKVRNHRKLAELHNNAVRPVRRNYFIYYIIPPPSSPFPASVFSPVGWRGVLRLGLRLPRLLNPPLDDLSGLAR